MPSFTSQVSDLQTNGPLAEVQLAVSRPLEAVLRQDQAPIPSPIPLIAMIDTGATCTCIQQGLAGQLGLNPVGQVSIHTPSSTDVPCNEYHVRLLFPNGIWGEWVVVEVPLQGQHIQCLIGRDVLAQATLVYIGSQNLFHLSF